MGKKAMPTLSTTGTTFEIGKAITVREGTDFTFIATGETVYPAFLAAQALETEGISCRVISMHTVKPLDTEALLHAARQTHALATVEEHSIYGGLGEACAAVLMQHGIRLPFQIIGISDEDTMTGSQSEIFDYYGISGSGLAASARRLLAVEQTR
jgi:transketolase